MTMRIVLGGCALLLAAAFSYTDVAAQTSTGSIRGTVADSTGAPLAGAEVIARNTSTGGQRSATTNSRGFYSLGGLTPAPYELTIRRIGHAPAGRGIRLQVGQVLTLDFRLAPATVELEELVVQTAPSVETQTSEVATNVNQQQIQNLPSGSRNFLDLASLAPSVRVNPDRINGTGKTFAAGALPAENINVFIDGKSLKNDVIGGGVIGQDASRGNPYPRNAVQEFRIITNNFKAEYQKSSSAIISAVTKSGGNEWEGSVFGSWQNQGLVALDSFARRDQAVSPATFAEPDYSRVLAGGSVGGPLVKDKLFLFAAYEGNFQNRQGVTRFSGDPAIWPAEIQQLNLERHAVPFRSHLGLAKLTYNLNQAHTLEFAGNLRLERDRRSFGGSFAPVDWSFQAAENFRQDIADGSVKHSWYGNDWTNEALAYYQWYNWNPEPLNLDLVGREFSGIGRLGGRDTRQDITQKRLSVRDDWTYSGLQWAGSHVVKIGANVDFLKYDVSKDINGNPVFVFNASNGFAFPVEARYGTGQTDVSGTNNQFGIYAQDDWSPTSRLTINAGIRWDYETGMSDQDFVTPPAVRDSILAFRDQFFVDVDPARYITDGDDRSPFKGAFQPRLGFSYAVDEAKQTTIFAGGGIFYDRLGYNTFLDETYRRVHPTYTFRFSAAGDPGTIQWDPALLSKRALDSVLALGQAPPQEIFLIPNDLKPPKTYQWNVGVRQLIGSVLASVSYVGARGRNGFTFEWANQALNPATNDCCLSANLPAYQNILVGNNDVRTWYDALEFRVDRNYQPGESFGWGAGIAYTLSWADQEGVDLFSFPQVAAGFNPKHPINDDQRHRIVANWVLDVPFAYGVQFSGLVTLASGKPFNRIEFVPLPPPQSGNQRVLIGRERGPWFKNVDLRLRKDFPTFGGTRLGVTADLINALNTDNLGDFDDTAIRIGPNGPEPNPTFGDARQVISDPRRFQVGLQYDF